MDLNPVASRFQRALRHPNEIIPYLQLKYHRIRNRRYLKRTIQGSDMLIDLEDSGINRTLAIRGGRELESTKAYRECLRELAEVRPNDEILVLDIGANIGYYALQPMVDIGDRVRVIAVEPDPSNVERLKRNIALNGYGDNFEVLQCGVGAKEGTETLYRAHQSNLHSFRQDLGALRKHRDELIGEIDVEIKPISLILNELDVSPPEVDVLRFDVEGYEKQVLEGGRQFLDESKNLLINVELHYHTLSEDEWEYCCDILEEKPIEFVSPKIERLSEVKNRDLGTEPVIGWRR